MGILSVFEFLLAYINQGNTKYWVESLHKIEFEQGNEGDRNITEMNMILLFAMTCIALSLAGGVRPLQTPLASEDKYDSQVLSFFSFIE